MTYFLVPQNVDMALLCIAVIMLTLIGLAVNSVKPNCKSKKSS